MQAKPFEFVVPEERIADLRRRLGEAHWPGDFGNDDGRYGLPETWLREAVDYWRNEFDWRSVEAEINGLPNFMVEIEGVPVHFIHIRSGRPGAIPIILSHGWPWSFWDWKDVISVLSKNQDPAFDIVVPSVPGFTLSTPLRKVGIDVRAVGRIWRHLMCDVLGYRRFAAAGADMGSAITAELGHAYPEEVIGVHLTLPILPGHSSAALTAMPFAPDEQWMVEQMERVRPSIVSHIAVNINDPQTFAYALSDSPLGLAAWLWKRRLVWSDEQSEGPARSLDFLCTLASLYWFTNCIGTSMRIYAEKERFGEWPSLTGRARALDVPTAFGFGPKELLMFPRAAAEQLTNLHRWTVFPHGGHFVAAEVPNLLASDYIKFFSELT
jgi:pimeloyl-ACP methyl ester carboxylesterase